MKNFKNILFLLTMLVVTPIVLFVYKKRGSQPKQELSIVYNKSHVEPLKGFEEYKDVNFKQIGKLSNPNAVFFHCWDNDPGDFKRVRIKLKSGRTIDYDNISGWLDIDKKVKYIGSVSEFIKIPEQPSRIKKHPYGMTLDMEGEDQLLILFGYRYATDPARLLTMIYIGADTAEIIFNKHFDLFEIREDESGYSLIGRLGSEGSHSDPYEIAIKDGKLTMEKLPLKKVYESQDPRIILYDAIGYGYHQQPGEFTRIEIIVPQENKYKEKEHQVFNVDPNGIWTPMLADVKIPAHTTTIKRTPYFIILENQIGLITLLSKRNYKDSIPSMLTILRSFPFYPTSLYYNYFCLQEILEDDTAYYLLGTRNNAKDPNKLYKITINKSTMSDLERNW